MSDATTSELGRVAARGTPRAIGRILGETGRAAVRDILLKSPYWQAVTAPAHQAAVQRMAANIRARFPAIREELEGLAEGLALPLEQVMAWNCRGDLMSNVPDGCTTVQIPGAPHLIAHNEDGLPGFRGHAFIADVTPDTGPGFMSFCYPGSLPGHTFAATRAGLVQTVNNLRLRNVTAQIPRMVLGRAVLATTTLDEALALLGDNPASGGFHMTLAQAGDTRLVSVEFGGGTCSQMRIKAPALHANHALHLQPGPDGQTITRSSGDRQAHGTALLAAGHCGPVAILRSTDGPGLPIHRTAPDDPDCENTLATAVFRVGKTGVEWNIFDQNSDTAVLAGGFSRS